MWSLDRIVETTAVHCAPEMLSDDLGDVLGLFDWDSLLSREHDVTSRKALVPLPAERLLQSAVEATSCSCWGHVLQRLDPTTAAASCDEDYFGGKAHFKNKFCSRCNTGMLLPLSHVRVLTPALENVFVNGKGIGLWSMDDSGLSFRVINQTIKCHGPKVVVFRERPDRLALEWSPMPAQWLDGPAGTLRVVAAKGTLVPAGSLLRAGNERRAAHALVRAEV